MCIMNRVVQSASLGVVCGDEAGILTAIFFTSHSTDLIFWLAVLVGLVTLAAYAIGKIRAEPVQKEPTASELLSKFRESHSRGEISDEEFRTIKTTLAARLQDELRDNGQKG